MNVFLLGLMGLGVLSGHAWANDHCYIEQFNPQVGLKTPYVLNCGTRKCAVSANALIQGSVKMRLLSVLTAEINPGMNERVSVGNFGAKNLSFVYDAKNTKTTVEYFFQNIHVGVMSASFFENYLARMTKDKKTLAEVDEALKKYGPHQDEKFLYKFMYKDFEILPGDCH